MNRNLLRAIFFIHFYFYFAPIWSQENIPTASFNDKKSIAVQAFDSLISDNLPVVNGVLYKDYRVKLSTGHPFYKTTNPVKGNINYDNYNNKNLSLLLDIVKGQLLVNNNNLFSIVINERLTNFNLGEDQFIYLSPKNSASIPSGFYKIQFQGEKTSLYIRPIKTIGEDLSNGNRVRLYINETSYYYVSKNKKFQRINNKRNLIKLFKDKKKEIKSFIRKSNFSDFEHLITATTAYYETL